MDVIEPATDRPDPAPRRLVALGLGLTIALGLGAWLDRSTGWVEGALGGLTSMVTEVPVLARLRGPGQLPLLRMHLAIVGALAALGLLAAPRLDRHGRAWWAAFVVAYAIRASAWIAGGNLPLVPGDSCHYVEVAASIAHGEGPVKHYADSFFIDYPPIKESRPVLDDWATPLYSTLLAGAYLALRIEPGADLEQTFAVAKGLSFACNLLTLPALYWVARRRLGRDVGLGAMALLAVLPVHALYAGIELRESLVGLTAVLAVGTLAEAWAAPGRSRWAWAIGAGVLGGLAILARHTTLALMAAAGLYGLVAHGRRARGPLVVWGAVLLAVIAPWGVATARAYGTPFYTITQHFRHTFAWTVHHTTRGIPRAADFFTRANAPTIARVKVKSLLIIVGYSTMILGLPTVLLFARRLARPAGRDGRDFDRLAATLALGFVAGTLANVADVGQVTQLGRYYMPLFALMLPTAVAGWRDWSSAVGLPARARPWLAAGLVALLWSDPAWAHDATWFAGPYQLHWPALRAAGGWARDHPELVPPGARVMTWFPWEFRLSSGRTTVLLPRAMSLSAFEVARIAETIEQYGVTHVLWGSFEAPPHVDPEFYGPELIQLRTIAGLVDRLEIYRSPDSLRFPVRLYRLTRGPR